VTECGVDQCASNDLNRDHDPLLSAKQMHSISVDLYLYGIPMSVSNAMAGQDPNRGSTSYQLLTRYGISCV